MKTFEAKITTNAMNSSLVTRRIKNLIIDVKIVFLNKNYMNMNFSPTLPPREVCINFIFASLATFNDLLTAHELGLNTFDQ